MFEKLVNYIELGLYNPDEVYHGIGLLYDLGAITLDEYKTIIEML